MPLVLLVEDDPAIRDAVAYSLGRDGLEVVTANDGAAGLALARERQPDAVVLDVMLPRMSGLDMLRVLRAEAPVPILLLTARDSEADRVQGLEAGADDYLTKPFNVRELVARVKAILRRAPTSPQPIGGTLSHGAITIDRGRHEVRVNGAEVQLAPKEFDLLWTLLEERGNVLTRDQLLERVWGYTFAGDTRTVDVHVRQLRRKLGDPCPIVTVWGVGYKVGDDGPAA